MLAVKFLYGMPEKCPVRDGSHDPPTELQKLIAIQVLIHFN